MIISAIVVNITHIEVNEGKKSKQVAWREITEKDREFFYKNERIDWEELS